MYAQVLLTNKKQFGVLKKYLPRLIKEYEKIKVVAITEVAPMNSSAKEFLFKNNIRFKPLSQIKIEHQIQELSLISTYIIKKSLKQISKEKSLKKIINYQRVGLLKVTANDMYTYHFRDFLLFIERLRSLITKDKPDVVLTFGQKQLKFASPERPAIEFLHDNEATFLPIIKKVCEESKIKLLILPNLKITNLKLKIRAFILTLIKFLKTLYRHIEANCFKKRIFLSGNKKIIGVIVRGESEYYTIKPVIERIRNREKDLQIIILQGDIFRSPSAKRTLDKKREDYLSLYSFLDPLRCIKYYLLGKKIQYSFIKKIAPMDFVSFPNSKTFNNLYARVLADNKIIKEVFKSMSYVWPETIVFIKELEKFIKTYKPKLILTMSMVDHWVGVERYICDKFHIPLITVQNALMQIQSMPFQVYAHKILVYGRKVKEGLIRSGEKADKIIITGAPQYDKYFINVENKQKIENIVEKELDITGYKKIILLTTQAFDYASKEKNTELISYIMQFLENHPDVYCLIKIHPREKMKEYVEINKLIKKRNLSTRVVQNINLHKLISIADVLVSRYSTTILTSLLAKTPPIAFLDVEGVMIKVDYLDTPATVKVFKKEELLKKLETILYDQNYLDFFQKNLEVFLKDYIGVFDGRAIERIIRVIRRMV